MPNAKTTDQCGMDLTHVINARGFAFPNSNFVINSSFVIRISSFLSVFIRVHSWLKP